MNTDTTPATRSGRIAAVLLLIFAVVYGIGGSRIEYAFASDPIGPRAFPVALAVILGLLCLLYLARPGQAEAWPRGATLLGAIAIPGLVAATALLLEPLGFPVVIFMLTAGVAWVFGAPWPRALLGGLVHAGLWYLVFGLLLEVYLPKGTLFGF